MGKEESQDSRDSEGRVGGANGEEAGARGRQVAPEARGAHAAASSSEGQAAASSSEGGQGRRETQHTAARAAESDVPNEAEGQGTDRRAHTAGKHSVGWDHGAPTAIPYSQAMLPKFKRGGPRRQSPPPLTGQRDAEGAAPGEASANQSQHRREPDRAERSGEAEKRGGPPASSTPPRSPPRKYRRPVRRDERSDGDVAHERQRLARMQEARQEQYAQSRASATGNRVVDFYNKRLNQGRVQREESPIIRLRKFNNWVKSVLINKYATEPGMSVLDLGCGKGGDLLKWEKARISSYVGIDAAAISIEHAQSRYNKLRHKAFDASFFTGDCFGQSLATILPRELQRKYNIVTAQFCIHYAFESEEKARQMLQNISMSLGRNEKFIGTVPNSDYISKRVKGLAPGEKSFGNRYYRITFDEPPPPTAEWRPPFGNKYYFWLEDAVDNVPEYVVPFESFRALAEDYSLEMVWHMPFHTLFRQERDSPTWGVMLDRLGVLTQSGDRGLEADEWEAAGIYTAFAFEKRGA